MCLQFLVQQVGHINGYRGNPIPSAGCAPDGGGSRQNLSSSSSLSSFSSPLLFSSFSSLPFSSSSLSFIQSPFCLRFLGLFHSTWSKSMSHMPSHSSSIPLLFLFFHSLSLSLSLSFSFSFSFSFILSLSLSFSLKEILSFFFWNEDKSFFEKIYYFPPLEYPWHN